MSSLWNFFGMNDKDKAVANGCDGDSQLRMDNSSNQEKSIEDLVRQTQRESFRNVPALVQKLQNNDECQAELVRKLLQERREMRVVNKRLMEEKIYMTSKLEQQAREIGALKNDIKYWKQVVNTYHTIPPPHAEMKLATGIFSPPASPRKQTKYVPRKKPHVHVYFFSPQRDQLPPISDITSRLAETLSQQDIELRTDTITETPVPDDARPAILLCINVSRVGTDVANAMKDMKADYNVAVVVLHHKDIHVLPKLSSIKSLTGREFQSLGTIVDMAFWKEKGLHQCDMNQQAIQKLSEFLKMFTAMDN